MRYRTSGRFADKLLELLGLGGFVVLLTFSFVMSRDSRRIRYASLATGVFAGLIFAREPGWSYGSVLNALMHAKLGSLGWATTLSAVAMFVGAGAGSMLSQDFRFRPPRLTRVLRCSVGGLLLGYGAALIPGGNDTLLLWAIPGLTAYGALAYGVMVGTIALLVWARQRWRPIDLPGNAQPK